MSGGVNWSEAQLRAHEHGLIDGGARAAAPPSHVQAPKARPRSLPAEQRYKSKAEATFAQWLDLQVRAGQYGGWKYEAVRLRLAAGKTYVPDFLVLGLDGKLDHIGEVKGRKGSTFFSRDLGKLKVSIAAVLFPWWRFKVYWAGDHGEWQSWEVPSK